MIFLSSRERVFNSLSKIFCLVSEEFPLKPTKISPTPKIAPCLIYKDLLKHLSINGIKISFIIKSGLKTDNTERA